MLMMSCGNTALPSHRRRAALAPPDRLAAAIMVVGAVTVLQILRLSPPGPGGMPGSQAGRSGQPPALVDS